MTNITDDEGFSNETTAGPEIIYMPDWINDAAYISERATFFLEIIIFAISSVHMIILTRKELRSIAIFRVMISVCFCDLTYNGMSVMLTFIKGYKEGKECFQTLAYRDAVLKYYVDPIMIITDFSAGWLSLFLVLWRVLSVMFPMSARVQRITKPSMVPWLTLVTLVCNGLLVLARASIFVISPYYVDSDCDGNIHVFPEGAPRYFLTIPNNKIPLYLNIVLVILIITYIPSFVEPVGAIFLVIELRKASKRRKLLSNSNENDRSDSITKLILYTSVILFVFEFPRLLVWFVYGFVAHNNYYVKTAQNLIDIFSPIIVFIYVSSHLFMCLFMSTQYRDTARALFKISKKQEVSDKKDLIKKFVFSTIAFCRYIGADGKEVAEPIESRVYPFFVVYCSRRNNVTMLGVTNDKSEHIGTEKQKYQHNVSFCLAPIYGKEPKWLHFVELVEHYKLQGVNKFFIYIREITNYDKKIVNSYVESGELEIIEIPGTVEDVIAQQLMGVADCLLRSRTYSKWSIYADIDERLIMTDDRMTIDGFLRNLTDESIGSVAFPQRWIMKREHIPATFESDEQVIQKLPTRAWHETTSAALKGHPVCNEQLSCWAKDIVHNEKVCGRQYDFQ